VRTVCSHATWVVIQAVGPGTRTSLGHVVRCTEARRGRRIAVCAFMCIHTRV
jgi:hypothetical protein